MHSCTYSPRSRSQIFSICSGCRYFRELLSNSSISLVGDSIAAGIAGSEAGRAWAVPSRRPGSGPSPRRSQRACARHFAPCAPASAPHRIRPERGPRLRGSDGHQPRSRAKVQGQEPGSDLFRLRSEPGGSGRTGGRAGGRERKRGGRNRKGGARCGARRGSWRESGVRPAGPAPRLRPAPPAPGRPAAPPPHSRRSCPAARAPPLCSPSAPRGRSADEREHRQLRGAVCRRAGAGVRPGTRAAQGGARRLQRTRPGSRRGPPTRGCDGP